MKKYVFILFGLVAGLSLQATNLQISNIQYAENTNQLSFDVQWDNHWYLSNNSHDAAWIFAKYAPNGGDAWLHVTFQDSVHQPGLLQYISHNDKGMMITETSGQGSFGPYTIQVYTEELIGDFQHFKVFGVECVFSPTGNFYAGDGSSDGRFYQNGNLSAPWYVTSEDAIMRGNLAGQFNQEGSSNTQNLSADYPKGYTSFYAMKYKVTAKQYVDFLNCLDRTQQNRRTLTELENSIVNRYVMTNSVNVIDRNPIKCDANPGNGPIKFYLDLDEDDIPNESEDGANLVMNHVNSADIFAYLDWIAMRPMSELEFEKLCRGIDMPVVPGELAWGTSTYNDGGSLINAGQPDEILSNVGILPSLYVSFPMRTGYAATNISNRTFAGATFTGILDWISRCD